MSIYKNSMGSKQFIEPLSSLTLSGSAQLLKNINLVTFGQLKKALIVIANADLSGAAVVTWYGSDATSGGNLTAIAAITIAIANPTTGVLQIDGEDISEAAEVAGLLPTGFLSLQCKVTGTNTDTLDACVVVEPLHERVGLTPSSVTALT